MLKITKNLSAIGRKSLASSFKFKDAIAKGDLHDVSNHSWSQNCPGGYYAWIHQGDGKISPNMRLQSDGNYHVSGPQKN